MSDAVLGNLFVDEGTLVGAPVVVTFPWRARKIVVTNDSTLNDVSITIFQQVLTLKPKETLTTTMHIPRITIDGTGDYRVWAFG